MSEIRNGNINNAKSLSSIDKLNCDVCIYYTQGELHLYYDTNEEQVIQLNDLQKKKLIEVLSN
tara:strand:- start:8770 stop:8958 length:189 start_codon:yes stop_codon:yes gene_type:complete